MYTRGTSVKPDRYFRLGTSAAIYPGTLASLTQAMSEAESESYRVPGPLRLYAQRGSERYLIMTYESGHCTWVYDNAES